MDRSKYETGQSELDDEASDGGAFSAEVRLTATTSKRIGASRVSRTLNKVLLDVSCDAP